MRLFSARQCMACVRLYALVAVVSCFSPVLRAAEIAAPDPLPDSSRAEEPTGELSLSQAIAVSLARNPDLAASGYDLKAADARIMQARLRPNPEVSVQLDNLGIGGAARGTDVLGSTLSLSQVIEMGDKRARRTDVAGMDRDLVGIERQAQQLDVLAEVARRFITVVAAQERVVFAQSARELAQRTLDAISTRVQAARSPEAERSRARIAVTRAQRGGAASRKRAAQCAIGAGCAVGKSGAAVYPSAG